MKNIDSILIEDISKILEKTSLLEPLRGKTIFITGATGLIGAFLIKVLIGFNRDYHGSVRIIALVRNEKRVFEVFGNNFSNVEFIYGDIVYETPLIEGSIDFVVHGASYTSSQDFVNFPVETIQTTMEGTRNTLELACKKKVRSFVYLSSMEVYGAIKDVSNAAQESDNGYLDILDIRSSYPLSKRMAENLCVSYNKEYGVPVKIARLTQTIGPGIKYNDTRVAAHFARSVIEQKDITLFSEGKTTRNLIYLRDACSAIFYILNKGNDGEAYNVANDEALLSIKETAEMIAKEIGYNKIKVKYDVQDLREYKLNKDLFLKLDVSKLKMLGWSPEVDIKEAYHRMIESLRVQI